VVILSLKLGENKQKFSVEIDILGAGISGDRLRVMKKK